MIFGVDYDDESMSLQNMELTNQIEVEDVDLLNPGAANAEKK